MELYNYCVVYNNLRRHFLFSAEAGISLDIINLFTGFPRIWYPMQDTIFKNYNLASDNNRTKARESKISITILLKPRK